MGWKDESSGDADSVPGKGEKAIQIKQRKEKKTNKGKMPSDAVGWRQWRSQGAESHIAAHHEGSEAWWWWHCENGEWRIVEENSKIKMKFEMRNVEKQIKGRIDWMRQRMGTFVWLGDVWWWGEWGEGD